MLLQRILHIAALLGLATLSACSYPMENLGFFKTSSTDISIFSEEIMEKSIDFNTVKSTSLAKCLQCHTGGGNDLSTAEKVLAAKEDVLESISNSSMPPRSSGYPALDACEKQILETWLENPDQQRSLKIGQLSNCGGYAPEPPAKEIDYSTLPVDFENLSAAILAPKCLSCHSGESSKHKTLLTSIELLKKQNLLIGDSSTETKLYKIVSGKMKRMMPPARSGISKLNEKELDYLQRWIESVEP